MEFFVSMTSKEGQSASEVDKREKSVRQRWISTAGFIL